jgi:hypothetical protein
MKRLLLGMVFGALLGAGGVKAHEVYNIYTIDDVMSEVQDIDCAEEWDVKRACASEDEVTSIVMLWCSQ